MRNKGEVVKKGEKEQDGQKFESHMPKAHPYLAVPMSYKHLHYS